MKASGLLITAAGCLGAMVVVLGQGQAPAQVPATPAAAAAPLQQGPGVQSANDARYREFVNSKCKNPPQPRGGGAGGGRGGGAAAPPAAPIHRDVKVTEIPGVIAAGQQWKTVWTGRGNNADGILADGEAMLFAQNTDSKVMKIDKNGKVSFPYTGTNTGGALAMNKKGALFVIERGLPTAILQLKPKRQTLANMYNGEPFECTGSGTNDLTADSKGGVYFTMGALYYANPKGVVSKQGTLIRNVNGLILSADEKTLYVSGTVTPAPPAAGGGGAPAGAPPAAGAGGGGRGGGQAGPGAIPPAPGAPQAPAGAAAAGGRGGAAGPPAPSAHVGVVAFDVQPDGSLTNEREFAKVGNDGMTIDAEGRVYVTGGYGVQVLSPDGKLLGEIPAPLNLITAAFAGKDKKTLYGVANNQQYVEIFTIQMIAQGYKGRAK